MGDDGVEPTELAGVAEAETESVHAWALDDDEDESETRRLTLPKDAGDVAEKLSLFSEHWSPKVVTRLNDYEVKVVKLHSEFVWHEPIGVVDEIIDPADTRRLAEPLTAARAGLDARGNILL